MAIIAQQWPTTLTPTSCRFGRTRNAELQLSPRTRKENVIQKGRPLWAASLEWRLLPAQLSELQYWLDGLDGFGGSVMLYDFGFERNPALTYSNTATATAIAAIGATSVAVSGLAIGSTISRGDAVQVGRRRYVVSTTVVVPGTGLATLALSTPLLSAVAVSDTLTLQNAACEMRLSNQDWSKSFSAGDGLHSVSADFIETVVDY